MTMEYSNFEYSTLEYTVASMKRPHLADLLRRIRVEAHLTQHQIAKKIGQTQSYVSKYEHGEQRLDLIELEAVCDAAGVSLSEFVRRYLES
jgi:transcriptional regulator with XRE-family HTH domain